MNAPTYCVDCDNPHPATRNKPPWQWRCIKCPVQPIGGWVDPDWRPDPPYELCVRINYEGQCPDFAPLRTPNNRAMEAKSDRA